MKAVIIENEDYNALPFILCDAIWEISHRHYGFTMISQETKHEIDKDTLIGALSPMLKKTLDAAEKET